MKARAKSAAQLEATVFGGHCFLEYWPHILTTGVEGFWSGDKWYVEGDQPYVAVNSTTYFTKEEFEENMELVND